MREFLKESGIRLIDWNVLVAEKLRNAEQGSESLKPLFGFGLSLGHGHLNYRGHEIYAEVLADVINQTIDSRP